MMPPAAGPIAIAVLNIAEFRAIAFVIASGSTSSRTNAWRAGASNAFAVPIPNASRMICQG